MKFAKKISVILIFFIVFSIFPVGSDFIMSGMLGISKLPDRAYAEGLVTIYSTDGRTASVYASEADFYCELGWHRSFEEVSAKVYDADGSEIYIYADHFPAYISTGRGESIDKLTTKTITPDGDTVFVYKSDVYKSMKGAWITDKDADIQKLVRQDGSYVNIHSADIDEYTGLGWMLPGKADPEKPMIALTFDDGPSAEHTKKIVDTITKYNGCATFFTVGEYVNKFPDIVKYTHDAGMEIASHTYNHANLTKSSPEKVREEIVSTSEAIKKAAGVEAELLRPPYGAISNEVDSESLPPLILWSIDTEDWLSRDPAKVYKCISENVKDGDIILMHDVYASTAEAVNMIVPHLVQKGFQLVSVSALAEAKGHEMKAGVVYKKFE